MERKLVFFAVSFFITLLLFESFGMTTYISALVIVVALCSAIGFLIKKHIKQAIAIVLGVAVAWSWLSFYSVFDKAPEFSDESVLITAKAEDYSYLNSKKSGVICDVEVSAIDGKNIDRSFRARLFIRNSDLNISPGDIINGKCKLEIPQNDKDFNSYTYYKSRGIDAIGFCNESISIKKSEHISFKYFPEYFSHKINERIDEILPERASGVVRAILLGDKTDFLIEDQSNFQSVGLAHVVAVSGMHLAFLASLISFLFGRRIANFIAIPVLILFTLVVGAPASVVRALIMQLVVIFAFIFRREPDSLTALALALVAILLFNPYCALDIGFQLSFAATLGLILCSGKINRYLLSKVSIKNKCLFKIYRFFASTISASLSAILFTTPIIILNFKTISIIAPISNLLLIWMVSGIFFVCIFALCASLVSLPFAKIVAYPAYLLTYLLTQGAGVLESIPYSEIFVDNIYALIFIAYIYVVIFTQPFAKNRNKIATLVCIAVVLFATILVSFLSKPEKGGEGVRFSVLDVGQGLSVVADYNDACVIVDCGGNRGKNAGEIADEYTKRMGYRKVDSLVLTHMHEDHINGAQRLIEKTNVDTLYLPEKAKQDSASEAIITSALRRGTEIHYISEETHVSNGGIDFIIYPTGWFDDSNEQGLVVLFKKDDFELIITGDIKKQSERRLCENYKLCDVEVYIVGHHGSDSSSSLEFMNTILPEVAVISVGKDNYYGHPHEDTLELFRRMDISVYRTDVKGNIVFYSDKIKARSE